MFFSLAGGGTEGCSPWDGHASREGALLYSKFLEQFRYYSSLFTYYFLWGTRSFHWMFIHFLIHDTLVCIDEWHFTTIFRWSLSGIVIVQHTIAPNPLTPPPPPPHTHTHTSSSSTFIIIIHNIYHHHHHLSLSSSFIIFIIIIMSFIIFFIIIIIWSCIIFIIFIRNLS